MKETYKKLYYDKLWSHSGDPFVDAGGYALKFLSKQFPDKDILELIEFATDIYVDRWDSKINPLFLNNNITQANYKPAKKKSETLLFFKGLLNETTPSINGWCRILGMNTLLFPAGRNLTVLSGSGAFTNFHHSFESEMMISKEAIIRYHFLPLACELLDKSLCVISSNNPLTSEEYAYDCCSRNLMDIGQNTSSGILKNPSRTTSTAIFRFIDSLLAHYGSYYGKEYISLYHFTNFGASPDLTIYTLPFQAFYFYVLSQRNDYRNQWNDFVAHYYRSSDLKDLYYDEQTSSYVGLCKKEKTTVEETQYKYWNNSIYDNLLKEKSILYEIRRWSTDHQFPLQLLEHYLTLIENMKNETIRKLGEIASFIMQNTAETDIGKEITKLNGINSASLLRRYILKVVEKNYALGNENAIVTVEDFTDYLFPEGGSWMQLRDVLLIYIYQKMHERNMRITIEGTDENDDFADDEE